ncbi:MAG: T9SS type A sorting domain-containing protein [Chryseobacterium sp.]|nr:T9SS type A sorting domain-containing protein [Chryseobacterium sp.]
MKRNLSLLVAAMLPLAIFGQSVSKETAHPFAKKSPAEVSSLAPVKKAPAAYCVQTNFKCDDGDVITKVVAGTINNPSTCGANGYNDFTSMSTTVTPSQVLPVTVTVGNGWFEKVSIWVDWNNNQTFEAGELMTDTVNGLGGGTSTGGDLSGTITVPATATSGTFRMRVMVVATGSDNPAPADPCADSLYGETEDYSLVIAATGCLTATEGQYPSTTFTPTCNGAYGNVTAAGYLNEYSKVKVTAGVTYTFATSDATYFITIGNEDGTTVLASGTGTATYTPTADGIVRFYSHLTSNCDGGKVFHTRKVKCGTPPTACSDFKTPSNNRENGGFFGGASSQRLAVDLSLGNSAFTVYGMEPIVAGTATSFSFKFYSNNAGKPGTQIATRTGTIVGSVATGTAFNYEFRKYTVTFDSPINLDANTVYWVEVVSDAVAWESTTVNRLGLPDVFFNDNTSGAWTAGTTDYVFNLICAPLAVNDSANAKFSLYPNPVKDFLNVSTNSKLDAVSIHNISGQKVASKIVDNRIDMSKLAAGVYVVNITLANGTQQSFKVVKQ